MKDLTQESMFDLRFMLKNEAKSDPELAAAIEQEIKSRQIQCEKEAEVERLSRKWSTKKKVIVASVLLFIFGSLEIRTYSGYKVYQDGSKLPYEKTKVMFHFPPFLHYLKQVEPTNHAAQPTKA